MESISDKKGISTAAIALAVVAIIGIAGVASYFVFIHDSHKSSVGEYETYSVLGATTGTVFDGKLKFEIVDESSTQYQIETSYTLYSTTDGIRTAFYIDSEREWVDIDEYESPGVKTGNELISTKWGDRNADIYTKVVDGETRTMHVGVSDGIIYRISMEVEDVILIFILIDTNTIKGNPGEGVGDYEIYSISGSVSGTDVDGIFFAIIVWQDNKEYEVDYFSIMYQTVSGVRTLLFFEYDTFVTDIDEYESHGVKTGTDTISTPWGTRNVDIYTQVIDGETTITYIGRTDGVPYKMTMTYEGSTLNYTLVGASVL